MKKSTLKIKLLFVLLLTIGFITLSRTNYSYCANEETFTMNEQINPIYEDVLSKEEKEYIKDELNEINEGKKYNSYYSSNDDVKIYTSYTELVNAVKSNMVERNQKFMLVWRVKEFYKDDIGYTKFINQLLNDVMSEEYAKTSDEGSYLKLNYGGSGSTAPWKYDKETEYYTYEINLDIHYFTTASQEAQLNKVVNNYIISYKKSGKKSKYEIISDFNDYVCKHVTYDYKHLNDEKYFLQYTAYAALINGTAVSQGYTALYYKLLDNMGINSIVVSTEIGNHKWNLVEYDGKWYHVDTARNDRNDSVIYRKSNFLFGKRDYISTGHNYTDLTVNSKDPISNYNIAYYGINLNPKVRINNFTVTFSEKKSTLNWKVPTGVDGINIKDADTDKLLGHFTKNQTSMTFPKVIIGKTYNFEIYSWKLVNGEKQYSVPTKLTVIPKLNVVTGVRATSAGDNYINISWNKYPKTNVTGYKVYKYNPSKKRYEYYKKTTSTSCKVTGLKTSNNYMFKVIEYLKVNGKEYNGKESVVFKAGTSTKVPTINKLYTKKKKVTINWKKVSGASGYEVYMKTSSKGSYKKIKTATSKTTKYTKSKLKKGKKCWFKIRTYRVVNGKKVYSPYSKVKSIKVK